MSIDFIPLNNYTPLWYHIMLAVTLITFMHSQSQSILSSQLRKHLQVMGIVLLLFVSVYMGFRPVSGRYFTDMALYNKWFYDYVHGAEVDLSSSDYIFHKFIKFCAQIMSNHMFFFVCALLYIFPLYIVSKKWFKDYWFLSFLLLVGSFSFWNYGVNGIRNGIAGSFVLLGMSRNKISFQILWFIMAVSFHKAVALPIAGFAVTQFYNKPKAFYALWLLCIPLSLALPGFWEGLFSGFIGDDRATSYLSGEVNIEKFKNVGFRWDFLFYSFFGVFAGWYYIFKKKLKDQFYIRLYNTYLFANAFWILVIRANFSNRFAYLSWFMMAVIIVYPWVKYRFIENQSKKMGWVMLGYIGFTYLMEFVYYQYIR